MRILLAALLVLLTLPGTAAAGRTNHPWSRISRAPLPHPMPEIIHGDCPGNPDISGCYVGAGEATLDGREWGRGAAFIATGDRYSKLHEIGHAFAATMMDTSERLKFQRLRDTADLQWSWADDIDGMLVQGMGTPDEDFADAYANCRMQHTPYGLWEAGYGYYPTPREHWRVCRLILHAAKDPGYPATPSELE